MRQFAVTLAILFTCLGALGQGKILFGNDSNHLFVLYGYGPNPSGPIPASPLPDGTSLVAVLYVGRGGSLSLQKSVVLSGAGYLTAGRMANQSVILTNVPGGAAANFQIFVTDTGAVLPSSINVGDCNSRFEGQTHFGTSGLFTAIPGTSLTYPSIATSASASTWAGGDLMIDFCLGCWIPIPVRVSPTNATVSLGGDVTFYGQPDHYVFLQWLKDFSPIAGATNLNLTLTNVSLSDAGKYRLQARDCYRSGYSDPATLTVFSPAIPATLGSPTYTANDQFQFTVMGTAGSNYVVQVATNLLSPTAWLPLITNASPFTFVDANAQNFQQRFYRAQAR